MSGDMMERGEATTTEYVAELRKRRQAYSEEALGRLGEIFRRRDRKPPEVFHDSSFLYIRSFDGDVGTRPFSGIVHWHSPDLLLSPITSIDAYTTTLQAGDTYVIRTVLRNRGDLAVPSAKVELFLTDPTLGFDTRYATRLTGIGTVPSAWVPSGGSAPAEFVYTVPPTEAGHKCLFARAFSFSPLELPLDDFALDPRLDRHVAQQNLNIVGQGQAFAFNLIHRPNARIRIALRPLQPEELLALRHPVLADVRSAREFPQRGWGRLTGIKLTETDGEGILVEEEPEGVTVSADDPSGVDLGAQRELGLAVRDVLASVEAGETKLSHHRDLLRKFREMTGQARCSRFAMTIPEIGLSAGEAVGLEMAAVDHNSDPPDSLGGIMIIIVGG
jgi:hypothetical protein